MKPLMFIGMVPLVLISASSFGQGSDERAVPRTGGSTASSDAGSRRSGDSSSSSSSGSSASSNSGGSNGSSASGNAGSFNSGVPDAASRRPRPGTGTGERGRYGNDRDRYSGYPNSYYYYDPYSYSWGYPGSRRYGSYGYGYGYYDYGYSYGDYYGYSPSSSYRSYRYREGNAALLRTLVEPAKARVYVDGYYAGIADDFDGLLQRLSVSPGRHDITFKLEGYRSHTFSVYANREQTLKLRWDMTRGSGDTSESIGDENARQSDRDSDPRPDMDRAPDRNPVDRSREVDGETNDRRNPAPARNEGRGELLFDIEPSDASVYVDGEFYGKASQVTRLELSTGPHRIEVVRPGYRTEESEVEVGREPKRVTLRLNRR